MMQVLDTTGLNCPMPILNVKKAMKKLPPGDTLEIIATDPGSVKDFEAFCKATGNSLLVSTETDGTYRFVLQRN